MTAFHVMREIGRGGFGVVEEVVDSTGMAYARKRFKPASYIPQEDHPRLRKRFKREVLIQAELGGNEIMPVVDSDLAGDSPWFLMPLASATYESEIEESRRTGKVNIDAIADIINGLQVLHDLGYVHRDLNPKNILRHDGRWKLSDLGTILPPTGNTLTLTENTVIYTEQYCSPEQRSDFHSAQPASDIYSFGCILHDLFSAKPRTPYAQHTASGPIGPIIEKCTESNPSRRPTISVLREILHETLVELGGHCKVEDQQSEVWLRKLEDIESWDEDTHADFARFFAGLDFKERSEGHENDWVYAASTPFLTRLPASALLILLGRSDGASAAVIEKYCDWARSTSFLFAFSDTVCTRLCAIFDHGGAAAKAMAMSALVELAFSHHRFYVMRQLLRRCGKDTPKDIARRISIELRTDELVDQFKYLMEVTSWEASLLAPQIARVVS